MKLLHFTCLSAWQIETKNSLTCLIITGYVINVISLVVMQFVKKPDKLNFFCAEADVNHHHHEQQQPLNGVIDDAPVSKSTDGNTENVVNVSRGQLSINTTFFFSVFTRESS